MKQDTSSNHFKFWPYVAEERDDDRNNGAFNLITHPEKIDLIHEATEENGLRSLFVLLNQDAGCFMTLGCASGQEDDRNYYSYFEFTLRDAQLASHTDWVTEFEGKWKKFLLIHDSRYPGIKRLLEGCAPMEWRYFHLRPESDPRKLVIMFLAAEDEYNHGLLVSHILYFFQDLQEGLLD